MVFDSSYGRESPLTNHGRCGEVIKGWDLCIVGGEGIPLMRVGTCMTLSYLNSSVRVMN
jgi:FKBP-type peptidyl-prolyl cis-trans isomerase